MTSGLSGSPALTNSRIGTCHWDRSCWTSIRHTVGGAHSVVAPHRTSVSSRAGAENRPPSCTSTVAPAFHGANRQDQACLAQPGEDTLRCTSPGCSPIQYIVDRCPTG